MVQNIIEWLSGIPNELVVFIISILPVLELRGGLVAASILGVDFLVAFPLCIIGNILPIPFILIFYNRVMMYLKRTKLFSKFTTKLEERIKKNTKKIENAKFVALMLFVGIPLPGTGGWTGAMVAAFLQMRAKKSFPAIALGIIIAAVIMSVLAYFIPGLFW